MIYLSLEDDGLGGQTAQVASEEGLCLDSSDALQLVLPARAKTDKIAAQVYVQTLANILRNGGAPVTVHIE